MKYLHFNFCFIFLFSDTYSCKIIIGCFLREAWEASLEEMGVRPKELTYLEVSARTWKGFLISVAQGPRACDLYFSGLEKQGWKAEVK